MQLAPLPRPVFEPAVRLALQEIWALPVTLPPQLSCHQAIAHGWNFAPDRPDALQASIWRRWPLNSSTPPFAC